MAQMKMSRPRVRKRHGAPKRWLPVVAAIGAVLAAAALTAGCSAGGDPAADPAATAASSPSALPSAARPATALPSADPTPADPPAQPSTVAHWGSFFGARRGNFDVSVSPVTVTLPDTVAEVGSSNSTQYALLTNGTLYAWGMGNNGQLGDGSTANSFTTPVQVRFPAGVRIAWIPTDVMPFNTGLAVDVSGHVWGWGKNGGGELCLGNRAQYTAPVQLPLAPVTALAGASNHALYDAHGTVYACGQNVEGDLGDGSTRNSMTPVRVAGLDGQEVTKLTASFANSGALLTTGAYFDWGYNASGQLGDGQAGRPSDVPVRVRVPRAVRQVALGGSIWNNGQTLVKLSNGSIWAWGSDRACQLGDLRIGLRRSPVQVHAPAGVTYKVLATGSATSYAISTAGKVYAWGVSHVGQIGNGRTGTMCRPVAVAAGAQFISATANNVVVSLTQSH
jgi:alpha-tubulin suppressor-like RCC1 family protein